LDFSLLARKKSHSTTHTHLGNIDLNNTLDSNKDEHLVQGQVQGGMEDDDVIAIPTLEEKKEKNVLIDEGDKTNIFILMWMIYIRWTLVLLSIVKVVDFVDSKFDEVLTNELISYVCIFSLFL